MVTNSLRRRVSHLAQRRHRSTVASLRPLRPIGLTLTENTNTHRLPFPPELPGYSIDRLLGSGGMADVWLGVQLGLNRPVAIKVLRDDDPEQVSRFEQEARLIAKLEHPNIVPIIDIRVSAAGRLCYVMRHLPGGDLAARGRPLPPEQIRQLLRALLGALKKAHEHGIVHRDVKPENVLYDEDGRPRLSDFGIALQRDATRLTRHGEAIGSVTYMSPEQARGAEIDQRSDLYSVGVMTFELLVGHPPFQGKEVEVLLKHQTDPVPTLPLMVAGWQRWLEQALAKSPGARFDNAEQMLRAMPDVDALALSAVLTARMPQVPAQTWRPWAGRGRTIAALLAVAALALLALWQSQGITPGTDPIVAEPPVLEPIDLPETPADAVPRDINSGLTAGSFFAAEGDSVFRQLQAMRADPTMADAYIAARGAFFAALKTTVESDTIEATGALAIQAFDAARELGATDDPNVVSLSRWVEAKLKSPLESIVRGKDRAGAAQTLTLAAALPVADPVFMQQVKLAQALPSSADLQRDRGGPALAYIAPAKRSQLSNGLLVMTAEVDAQSYARFLQASGKSPRRCAASAANVARCLTFDDATAYAQWLSGQTGQRYRLPTWAEWQALPGASPLLAGLDNSHREWTASCEMREKGAVRKVLGNFGRAIAGKEKGSETYCAGRYVASFASGRAQGSVERESLYRNDVGLRLVRMP